MSVLKLALLSVVASCTITPSVTTDEVAQQSCSNPGFHVCLPGDLGDLSCIALCDPVAYCGTCTWVPNVARPCSPDEGGGFQGVWVSDRGLSSDCPQSMRRCRREGETTSVCLSGRPL